MSQKFEIELKAIKIHENGLYEKELRASNFLEALIFYPKMGVPSIRSILKLKMEDEKELFTETLNEQLKFPKDLTGREREIFKKQFELEIAKDRVLFRNGFEGTSYLELNISTLEKADKLENAILKILGKVAVTAIGTITGIGSVVKAAATSSTESIFGKLANKKDKIKSIGRGLVELDWEKIVQEMKDNGKTSYETTIDLIVPEDIKIRPVQKWTRDGKLAEGVLEPKKLSAGKINGTITLEIKNINQESMKQRDVIDVKEGDIDILKISPPILRITAKGGVPSEEWKNPQLIPHTYIQLPDDGIWGFDFVAEGPEGSVNQNLTSIVAQYDWKDFPTELKGVRIHASTNDLVLRIDEDET